MEMLLTTETGVKFAAFAEGFVEQCMRDGMGESEIAQALEQTLPRFIAERSEHGSAGFKEAMEKSALTLGAMARAGAKGLGAAAKTTAKTISKTKAAPWSERLAMKPMLGAAGLAALAGTDNPVSESMPGWMRDATLFGSLGGLGGRVAFGRGGGAATGALAAAGGAATNIFRHTPMMDAAGYTPDYMDPAALARGGGGYSFDASAIGQKVQRHRTELQGLEAQMNAIKSEVNSSPGLGGQLQRQMRLRELNNLERRHRELTGEIGRSLAGVETDQARMRADGADRLSTINTHLSRARDVEAPIENALARESAGGFSGLAQGLWNRLTGAEGRARDAIARRRALEFARDIENNRANFSLLPSGWNN